MKFIIDKWNLLKNKIVELDDVEIVSKNNYINWVYLNKNLCYFIFRKNSIVLELGRGNVNPDGSKSKNYFDIDDPKTFQRNLVGNGNLELKELYIKYLLPKMLTLIM